MASEKSRNPGVLAQKMLAHGLVDVRSLDATLQASLAYATEENFLGKNVYGDLVECFLQEEAARMLVAAQAALRSRSPDLSLLLWDCARPLSVQKVMWELVKGTPRQSFVANPEGAASVHNYGCAVDLTISLSGIPLDMGTAFDDFTPLAQPRCEKEMLAAGRLTLTQLENRLLLREVMTSAGFTPIAEEWWHFDALPKAIAKKKYRIIE